MRARRVARPSHPTGSGAGAGPRRATPGHTRCVWHDPARKPIRFWTRQRIWRLAALIEDGLSDEQIARKLGTTANGVVIARKRYGLKPRSKVLLSAREIATRLGIGCAKSVARWIEHGWIAGRKGQGRGPHRQWFVTETALMDFLADPAHWHRWRPERIGDRALREWATEIRQGVRFLTLTEVADRMCVQPQTVHQWIAKGWLPAVRNGNHQVRERDLDAFELPKIGGRRVVHPERSVIAAQYAGVAFDIEVLAVAGGWIGRVWRGGSLVWESRRPLVDRRNVVGSCQRAAKRIAERRDG